MILKKILLQSALFVSLLAISSSTTYLVCYANKKTDSNENSSSVIRTELTPQEKLLNSLNNIKTFDLQASIDFSYQKNNVDGYINFNGSGDFSDLTKIKLQGDVNGKFGSFMLSTSLGFYDQNLYFNLNNNYMYLSTNNVLDFISTLPSMGLNLELPNELTNLNLSQLEEGLLNMTYTQEAEKYYFNYNLSDIVSLIFVSDNNFNLQGIKTNKFSYKDFDIALQVDLKISDLNSLSHKLISPTEVSNGPTYFNFSPAFSLVNGMYSLFKNKQNGVDIKLNLKKDNSDFINANLNLNYDLDKNKISFAGLLNEKENVHHIQAVLEDSTIYANYNDALKVSIENQTINGLVDYLFRKFDDSNVKNIITKISELTNNIDVVNFLSNFPDLNKFVKSLEVKDNTVKVVVDLSYFDSSLSNLSLTFSLDHKNLLGISLNDFSYNGYLLDLNLNPKEYQEVIIDKSSFAKLEYPLMTIPDIKNLINLRKYRLIFDGNVTSIDNETNPIDINGDLQFDLTDNVDNGYGYGSLSVVDQNSYRHNLYIDVKDKNQVLFKYNEKMLGKFKSQTVVDIYDVITDLIKNKDEHFTEIFKDVLSALEESNLTSIIENKDYGKLLSMNIVKNLQTSPEQISLDLDASIIGLKDVFSLVINTSYNEETNSSTIESLQVKDINVSNKTINFEVFLKDFDSSLEKNRLNANDKYLDFSDIKFLILSGINTSNVDDWIFKGKVNLKFSLSILPDFDVNVDIRIKNIKGKIKASFAINDIPVVSGINPNPKLYYAKNRNVVFYYSDNLVYGQRTETGNSNFLGIGTQNFEANFVSTLDNFFDNILDYLLKFTLSLNDSFINMINKSTTNGPTKENPIHYENVLKNFSYNKEGEDFNGAKYPYYLIDLNLEEITKNSDLKTFNVKIYEDNEKNILKGLSIYLGIDVGIEIYLSANVELIDFGKVIDFSDLDNYVSLHKNDKQNQSVTDVINNASYK